MHDALLHKEALLVVSTSDFEHIALVVITHEFTVYLLAHPSIEEGTTAQLQKVSFEKTRPKLSAKRS